MAQRLEVDQPPEARMVEGVEAVPLTEAVGQAELRYG
jgi:hypothetical protein